MALNVETLKTRALTALIFVLVMLAGLLWVYPAFLALFLVIHFGCWYELIKLLKLIHGKKFPVYALIGLVYITMPVLMIVDLRSDGNLFKGNFSAVDDGKIIPCAILFSIWINDTMAYLVGSVIGKTPFSKISPKKTIEGTLGGILLCVLTIALVAHFSGIMPVSRAIVIAATCAIFGTAGDLLESKIKRMAGVKDSGSFMPGHGGFLDRFDSLLVAIPFTWICLRLFF
ncbi:MAG: phosphatidate cytidylyltransferase [Chitinophagaceae bacterium]|nr:phosphatidate cytidylyltransferase [Chitinophagaceae bacterium]